MKAALKNDWYYLRFLLPILLIFSVLSTVTYNLPPDEGYYSLVSPLLYASCIPAALFLLNERSRWGSFFAAMPGKRSAFIHAKYIAAFLSIIFVMAVLVISCIVYVFASGNNEMDKEMPILLTGFSVSLFLCSMFLPIITRFGAKVGVIIFFIMMFICGIAAGFYEGMIEYGEIAAPDIPFGIASVGAAIIIYLISWLLSFWIYKSKEL